MAGRKHKNIAGSRQSQDTSQDMEINMRRKRALEAAALQALKIELAIVVAAADQLASGHALECVDFDRLHQAHQFLIQILADLEGIKVLT